MLSLTAALLLLCDWETQHPVQVLLVYLMRHQNDDGSWQRPPATCRCYSPHPLDTRIPVVPDPETVRRFQSLVPTLGSDCITERESAQNAIYGLGPRAIPLLQDAMTQLDPEIRWRCRDTLERHWKKDATVRGLFRQTTAQDPEDFGLKATSLALLNFLGAGYSQHSRDQRRDPVNPGSTYVAGRVIHNALRWLVGQQKEDGSFPSKQPVTQAIAALALIECYGMTASGDLQEAATRAAAFIATLKATDPDLVLWKEFVHCSAGNGDLAVPHRDPEAVLAAFKNTATIPGLSRKLVVSSLLKAPCDEAKAGFLRLRQDGVSPEDRFLLALAVCLTWKPGTAERNRWQDSVLSGWKNLQITTQECQQGTWSDASSDFEERMLATLFTGLTLLHTYRFANALFAPP